MRDQICLGRAAPPRPSLPMRRSLAAFLCWSLASCIVPLSASGAALADDGKSGRDKSGAGGSAAETGTGGESPSGPEDNGNRETGGQEDAREAVVKGEILPLRKLLALVDRDRYGMVIAVDLVRYMGSAIYRLKTRDGAGVIRDLRIDARTGRFVKF